MFGSLDVDRFAHAQERLAEVSERVAFGLRRASCGISRALAGQEIHREPRFIWARRAAEDKFVRAADATLGALLTANP